MNPAAHIYQRRSAAYRRYCATTTALACRADPATGGNQCLCHNWGNEESRAIWQRRDARWNKIGLLFDAAYYAVLHVDHGPDCKPLWCQYCKA